MKNWNEFVTDLAVKMGFRDYKVDIDTEHNHGTLYLYDDQILIKENLPSIVESVNYIVQLVARKENEKPLFLDINNYRKEREQLIIELARAAARKTATTKKEIALPIMNSYERRIAHAELASRPDVITESAGKGRDRHVVIKPMLTDEDFVQAGNAESQPTTPGAARESINVPEIDLGDIINETKES